MPGREFSDEELRLILHEAARLSTDDAQRHSLQDIQAIAAEAQIAPEYVAQAIESLAVQATPGDAAPLVEGAGTRLERRVARVASPAEIMAAIALARAALGETGTIHDVAGGSEWRYDNGFTSTAMSLVPDANGTVVRIDARADGQQFALIGGVLAASLFTGMSTAAAMGTPAGVIAGAVALGASALAARAWWNRSARAARARLAALASAVAARLRQEDGSPA